MTSVDSKVTMNDAITNVMNDLAKEHIDKTVLPKSSVINLKEVLYRIRLVLASP